MQVGDQVARLARFGRQAGLGMLDHTRRQTEAARDFNAARCSGDADQQPVSRPQIFGVEFHGGIQNARRGRCVRFQAIVVRGGDGQGAARAKLLQERHGQRRTLFGGRAGAHLVDQDQRTLGGDFEHRFQIEGVRGKGREIGGDRLLIADVRKDVVENGQHSAFGGHRNSGLRGQRRKAHGLE